jgi:hypothetical protein
MRNMSLVIHAYDASCGELSETHEELCYDASGLVQIELCTDSAIEILLLQQVVSIQNIHRKMIAEPDPSHRSRAMEKEAREEERGIGPTEFDVTRSQTCRHGQ